MTITATSHAFAAGDIDYINNLNLVRADVGSVIADANTNPKGTMAAQNANAVNITGGTINGVTASNSTVDNLNATFTKGASDPNFTLGFRNGVGATTYSEQASLSFNYGSVKIGGIGFWRDGAGGADSMVFSTGSNVERLRISGSGLVGIGGTPSHSLQIMNADARLAITPSLATNSAIVQMVNTGGTAYIGLESSAGGISGPYALNVYHSSAYPIVFSTSGLERMRVDAGGALLINTTTDNATDKLQVNGTASVTSPAGGSNNTQVATTAWVTSKYASGFSTAGVITSTSSTAGVGYAAGAGGSVTQATSITTAVTLNKISGKIDCASIPTFNSGDRFTFTFNNSTIAATDVVVLNIVSQTNANVGDVFITSYGNGAGSRTITLKNVSSSNFSSVLINISFAVIKAVTS